MKLVLFFLILAIETVYSIGYSDAPVTLLIKKELYYITGCRDVYNDYCDDDYDLGLGVSLSDDDLMLEDDGNIEISKRSTYGVPPRNMRISRGKAIRNVRRSR